MTDGFFIDGVDLSVEHTLLESFTISQTANGVDTLTADIDASSNHSPALRPGLDGDVAYVENGVTVFGGRVTGVREHELTGEAMPDFVTEVSASDYGVLAHRRYVNGSRPAESLKDRLVFLTTFLAIYGVTLDAGQPTGPTVPAIVYTYMLAEDAFNDLVTATAAAGDPFAWRINGTKVLQFEQPAAAPFNLADGDDRLVGDIEVEETRADTYANRVIAVNSNVGMTIIAAEFVADGVATSWVTPEEADPSYFPGVAIIDGVQIPIELAPGLGLFFYTWDPSTHTLAQRSGDTALTAGTTIRLLYGGRVVPALGRVDTFIGDGSTVAFALTANVITPSQTVVVDGAAEPIGAYPDPSWLLDTSVSPPMLTRTSAPANGATVTYTYDGFVPGTAVAEDAGQIAAHGLFELVVSTSATTFLQAFADATLAEHAVSQRTIRWATHETGLAVGQIQHVSSAKRNLDADFLISEIVISYEAGQVPVGAGGPLRRAITAIESVVPKPNWRDVYKQWADKGQPAAPSGVATGLSVPDGVATVNGAGGGDAFGSPTQLLLVAKNGSPWSIVLRRADLGPDADIGIYNDAGGFIVESKTRSFGWSGTTGVLYSDLLRLTATPYASLPASPVGGTIALIGDSPTDVWRSVVSAGGGPNTVLAIYLGGNWVVFAVQN